MPNAGQGDLKHCHIEQNLVKSHVYCSGLMPTLLWQRRIDVAICLLLQTSLITSLQVLQSIGDESAETTAIQMPRNF